MMIMLEVHGMRTTMKTIKTIRSLQVLLTRIKATKRLPLLMRTSLPPRTMRTRFPRVAGIQRLAVPAAETVRSPAPVPRSWRLHLRTIRASFSLEPVTFSTEENSNPAITVQGFSLIHGVRKMYKYIFSFLLQEKDGTILSYRPNIYVTFIYFPVQTPTHACFRCVALCLYPLL